MSLIYILVFIILMILLLSKVFDSENNKSNIQNTRNSTNFRNEHSTVSKSSIPNDSRIKSNKNEVIVDIEKLNEILLHTLQHPKNEQLFDKCELNALRGFKKINIPKTTYYELLDLMKKNEEENRILLLTGELNNKGIEFERAEKIDDAIDVYEQNIQNKYPAHHSYKRLMVLYRKRKDFKNEIRIIRTALEVFKNYKEYEERLEKVIEKDKQQV